MFFEFTQNNSYGYFDVDDKVCHRLFIEADNAEEANIKAQELGCYWDGVANGIDCSCCGDRWYIADEDNIVPIGALKFDSLKFNSIEDYVQYLADNYGWTTPDCRIYYKDGKIKEIFSCKSKKGE